MGMLIKFYGEESLDNLYWFCKNIIGKVILK